MARGYGSGYSSYRGRTPKGKIVLAVLLVLVIAAALVTLALQRYVFFDDMGHMRLQLPQEAEQPLPEDVELTIQDPQLRPQTQPGQEQPEKTPEVARQITVLTAMSGLSRDSVRLAAEAAMEEQHDAVAVTVRDSAGYVYFDSVAAVSSAKRTAGDAALRTLADSDTYTVARFACFRDNLASNADVEGKGLKNTGGYIFYDGNNYQWLDPAKEEARTYLCALARETAELGVDEIMLTNVSYPTEGKLNKIAYGDVDREAMLLNFLDEVREALEPYGVTLSIELPSSVLEEAAENPGGLTLAGALSRVNRVYLPTTPERLEEDAARIAEIRADAVYIPVISEAAALPEGYTGSCLYLD